MSGMTSTAAPTATVQAHSTTGVVNEVDAAADKVMIAHEAIKGLCHWLLKAAHFWR